MKNCNLIVIISVLLVVIVNITYYSKKSYFMILFLIKKIKDYFMKKNIFIALGFLLVSLVIFTGCEPNPNYWDDWDLEECWLYFESDANSFLTGGTQTPVISTTEKSGAYHIILHKHEYNTKYIYCDYKASTYSWASDDSTYDSEYNIKITSKPYELSTAKGEDNFFIWCDSKYVYVANNNMTRYAYDFDKKSSYQKTYRFDFTGIKDLEINMKKR